MSQVDTERKLFYLFLTLIGLVFLTTGIAFLDLGWMNFAAALIISGLQASLVGVFFMHLRIAEILVKVFAAGTLLWLLILISGTFIDYVSRPWMPIPSMWEVELQSVR